MLERVNTVREYIVNTVFSIRVNAKDYRRKYDCIFPTVMLIKLYLHSLYR